VTDRDHSSGPRSRLALPPWRTNERPLAGETFGSSSKRAPNDASEMGLDLSADGRGALVTVYAEIDESGVGKNGVRYRVAKSDAGVGLNRIS
jgi:hypothetical protein